MNAMFFQQVRLTHAYHHWPRQISTKLKTSKVTQTEIKQNKRTDINAEIKMKTVKEATARNKKKKQNMDMYVRDNKRGSENIPEQLKTGPSTLPFPV